MPKILFAVDGSEASLRAAQGLAGILRWWKTTDVEVLNVQPESFIFRELVPHSLRERAESRVREEGERALAMAHALLRGAAAECATTVRFGDAATAIAGQGLGVTATARNWNTVAALLDLVDAG